MPKVLIVDDEKATTDLIEQVVLSVGYEPTSVNESYKTFEVADVVQPDIFILDLMMPGLTGFQVCRMLRSNPSFVDTPIIIVTALDDRDSQVVAFGAGANAYITKPFHIDELTQRMKALLGE